MFSFSLSFQMIKNFSNKVSFHYQTEITFIKVKFVAQCKSLKTLYF